MKKSYKDVNDGKLSKRAPDYLSKQAGVTWRKVAGFLEDNSAVSRIDEALVELYCTNYEIYRNAYAHIQENGQSASIYKSLQNSDGEVIGKDFTGYKRNPMIQVYNDAAKNLVTIARELGLSPKSRSELLEIAGDSNEVDEDVMKKWEM